MDFAALIGRVQRLLLSPVTEWDAISSEPADVQKIYMNYVGPLVIAAALATALGLLLFGANAGFMTIRMPFGTILTFLILNIVLTLVSVYISAYVINALAPQFGGTQDMGQAFKVAAYSPTATWVAGLVTILPQLAIVVWLGVLYSLYLLYLGLPKLMKPAADKTVPYTIAVVVVMIVIYIVVGGIVGAIAFGSGMPMAMSLPQ